MKHLIATLALVLLFALTACGSTSTSAPEPQPVEPTPIAVTEAATEAPMEETVSGTLIDSASTLIGTWHGKAGGWMVIRPDGTFRGTFKRNELVNTKPSDTAYWDGTYSVEGGRIVFEESSIRCGTDEVGVYQAFLLQGDRMRFTLVSDDCGMRINTLLGQRVEPVIDVIWERVSPEAPHSMDWFRSIELPFIPHDLAVDAAGIIYAIELGAPSVHKLDREGNVLTRWGSEGSEAEQFAFDPPPDAPPLDGGFVVVGADGNVYVSDSYNNRVQIFDPDGNFLSMWESYGPEGTAFDNPGPISADSQGNVYVADFGGVHQFDTDGNYVRTLMAAGEVALDSQGNLFTTVAFENIALKFPAGGGEPLVFGGEGTENGQFMTPMWVVVGPDDTVYVSDHSGRVQRFDSEGNLMAVWSAPSNDDGPLTGPSPLAQDAEGNIYVATKDRTTVYVLSP